MVRNTAILRLLPILLVISVAGCSKTQTPAPTELAAVSIVEKNFAARGGLQAWRAVESMSMSGLMDAGKARDPMKLAMALQKPRAAARAEAREALLQGSKVETDPGKIVQLPFVMELKRPRKMRLEVQFNGQTAVQVFDGENGWKLRPFLGRREVERYTAAEQQAASNSRIWTVCSSTTLPKAPKWSSRETSRWKAAMRTNSSSR